MKIWWMFLFLIAASIIALVSERLLDANDESVSTRTNTPLYHHVTMTREPTNALATDMIHQVWNLDQTRIDTKWKPIRGRIYPISFSFPRVRIRPRISKTQFFGTVLPGKQDTYVFKEEELYMNDYGKSWFGITHKKGGWDCMRHLEIMGANCIPFMQDIDQCPEQTMFFYPKGLMQLLVHHFTQCMGHSTVQETLLSCFQQHLQKYLTCEAMIRYMLRSLSVTSVNQVLFINDSMPQTPDYLSMMTLIGLKRVFGKQVTVCPECEYLYDDYSGNVKQLNCYGFNYVKTIAATDRQQNVVSEQEIRRNITNHKYDLIVYGSMSRSWSWYNHVKKHVPANRIWLMQGEDHSFSMWNPKDILDTGIIFYRELDVS